MAGLNNFDATKIAPDVGFSPLAAGTYICVITGSDMKTTQKGDGEGLSLTFEVVDGPNVGRKTFDWLNMVNKNATTVEIAQKKLSAICHAVGVLKPVDSAELHDRPLQVTVKIKDGRNEVTGYAAANGVQSPSVTTAPATASNVPAATKPWMKAA